MITKGFSMKKQIATFSSVAFASVLSLSFGVAHGAETAEKRPANAPHQQPAFPEQTRAPLPQTAASVKTELFADDLPHLWAFEFLPDGRIIANAKDGQMLLIKDGKEVTEVSGVPEVDSAGQGGLLDIAVAPDFATSKTVYFTYAEPRDDGNGTSLASAQLSGEAGAASLTNVQVIFRQTPTYNGDKHFGSRIAFDQQGNLFVTVGERSDAGPRVQSQDLSSGLGKIFYITPDGKAVDGNPFISQDNAIPEIWSYGHRNLQSAATDSSGRLWTVEHGPKGGDELNLPLAGKNYGWPVITYGVEYSGATIGDGLTAKEGMEQPVYYWDPVIGPSGMAFYNHDKIPQWKGKILIGGLVAQGLVILGIENDKVASEERVSLDARIRDVKTAEDGTVYALTEQRSSGGSTIIKISAQ
jgi:glucose/arabinose dehydrogenase